MPIPALPLFKHRDTVVTPADQNQFVTQFENTMDTMSNDVIPAMNTSIDRMNTQYNNIYNNLPFAPNSGYSQAYIDANIYKKSETYNKTELDTSIIDSKVDRIGLIDYGYVAKPYHIVAFGGEFNRADYPKLWAYLQTNPTLVKTQAQWTTQATANGGICGFFSDGNGATTFRVPNLDKAFLRPDNRGAGSYQSDAFQGHWHEVINGTEIFKRISGGGATSGSGTVSSATIGVENPISDRINGTPRTANETRPKNIAVLPLIVAK